MKKGLIFLALFLFLAYCIYAETECDIDSDCGNSSYIGSAFCDGDYLKRVYTHVFCQPAIEASYCNSTNTTLITGSCYEEEIIQIEPPSGELYVTNIIFGQIHRFYLQDLMEFSIFLKNNQNSRLEDLKISILIFDLGRYYSFDKFDLLKGEAITKRMTFYVPELAKGTYDVRIVVSNDDLKRVFHRQITIS